MSLSQVILDLDDFDYTKFDDFKNDVDAAGLSIASTPIVNSKISYSQTYSYGADYYYYYSYSQSYTNGSPSYTNNYSGYTQSQTSYSGGGHSDYAQYYNRYSASVAPYGYSQTYHSNYSYSRQYTAHSNSVVYNNYSQYSQYTQSSTYYYSRLYSQYGQYVQYTQVGFDRQEYVPDTPTFYILDNGSQVKKTTVIGLHALDKNSKGLGTQDVLAKAVYYNLRIRKIKTVAGVASVSAWRTLINGSTTDVFELNTIDPLSVGATGKAGEGYYEVEAYSYNQAHTEYGVTQTYVSGTKLITVLIKQNDVPEITVINGTEFIDFNFSSAGVVGSDSKFRTYTDGLYIESVQQDGLFVKFQLYDVDSPAHAVKVYVENNVGAKIATTEQIPILQSENIDMSGTSPKRTAYYTAFIPYTVLDDSGSQSKLTLVVEASDFEDAGKTLATGDVIIVKKISLTNSTDLIMTLDDIAPTVNTIVADATFAQNKILSVGVADTLTGINRMEYFVSKSDISIATARNYFLTLAEQSGLLKSGSTKANLDAQTLARVTANDVGLVAYVCPVLAPVTNAPFGPLNTSSNYTFTKSGPQWIYVRVIDNSGNEQFYKSGQNLIDKTATTLTSNVDPILSLFLSNLLSNADNVPSGETFTLNAHTITRDENGDVSAGYASDPLGFEIVNAQAWFNDTPGTKYTLTETTDLGHTKDWARNIALNNARMDGLYNMTVETTKKTGLKETFTVPVTIETPIDLSAPNVLVFEPNKNLDFNSTTSKYVSTLEVKLYIGTAYETGWLPLTSVANLDTKSWSLNYTVPAGTPMQNVAYNVRATTVNGKVQTLSSYLIYGSINNSIIHTPQWETNRVDFNINKTGNANLPRTLNTFFAGEAFVVNTDVSVNVAQTSVESVKITMPDYGYTTNLTKIDVDSWTGQLWDVDMLNAWPEGYIGTEDVEIEVEYKLISTGQIAKVVYTNQVVVDCSENFWNLHRTK